jgi:hypothetical protein
VFLLIFMFLMLAVLFLHSILCLPYLMALFLFFLFCLFCSVLFRVALFWLVLCCLLGDSVVVDLMCSCLSKVDLDGVLVFIYEFVPCCDGIK